MPRKPPIDPTFNAMLDGVTAETLDQRMARVYGMDPNADRLSLLPRVKGLTAHDWGDWTAPAWLYEALKAVELPRHAAEGGRVTPEETISAAMTATGGGLARGAVTRRVAGEVGIGGTGFRTVQDLALESPEKLDQMLQHVADLKMRATFGPRPERGGLLETLDEAGRPLRYDTRTPYDPIALQAYEREFQQIIQAKLAQQRTADAVARATHDLGTVFEGYKTIPNGMLVRFDRNGQQVTGRVIGHRIVGVGDRNLALPRVEFHDGQRARKTTLTREQIKDVFSE